MKPKSCYFLLVYDVPPSSSSGYLHNKGVSEDAKHLLCSLLITVLSCYVVYCCCLLLQVLLVLALASEVSGGRRRYSRRKYGRKYSHRHEPRHHHKHHHHYTEYYEPSYERQRGAHHTTPRNEIVIVIVIV